MEQSLIKLKFKKLNTLAKIPTRASLLSAGADLYSMEETIVPPRGKQLIGTGLQVQIPPNCYGRIAPRSGMAWNHHIDVGAGVVDPDYTGEVKVLLFNHGVDGYMVKRGDRIAQLICEMVTHPIIEEIQDDLERKEGRGDHGFGSSGK
uniref:Deoxyuridine 5'-triphosphate nucleotidohydrolase n=1 Tax=Tetranychus urticae TaxID=32264 RepID=T1KV04_TETUR